MFMIGVFPMKLPLSMTREVGEVTTKSVPLFLDDDRLFDVDRSDAGALLEGVEDVSRGCVAV